MDTPPGRMQSEANFDGIFHPSYLSRESAPGSGGDILLPCGRLSGYILIKTGNAKLGIQSAPLIQSSFIIYSRQ